MSRQITILVMVDVEAALDEGTLENNVYLMDSERASGSEGCGTGRLTTAVECGMLMDGSQAEDVVLNWCVGCIQAMPATLPRFYMAYRRNKLRSEVVGKLLAGSSAGQKLMAQLKSVESEDADTTPYLTDITGEAVDAGVIFPAQYGTPVPVHGGWYWSASVSTYRPGVYRYVLHLKLFKRNGDGLEAVELACEAALKITHAPQRNGFTGGGMCFLPIKPCMNDEPKEKRNNEKNDNAKNRDGCTEYSVHGFAGK